jgi:hypothetical protein
MGLPSRDRVDERWYLYLPGVSSTEAYVFAFVEDTSGSDLRSDPSCDDTCSCCPDSFEPQHPTGARWPPHGSSGTCQSIEVGMTRLRTRR